MTRCQFIADEHDPELKRCTRPGCGRTSRAPNPPERIVAPCRSRVKLAIGAGTLLEASLARWNFKHCDACDCQAKARLMDRAGWQWCARHVDTIVAWLRDNAAKCGYPYVELAAYILVRRSIHRARRAAQLAERKS